jgi:hypothetical protein
MTNGGYDERKNADICRENAQLCHVQVLRFQMTPG